MVLFYRALTSSEDLPQSETSHELSSVALFIHLFILIARLAAGYSYLSCLRPRCMWIFLINCWLLPDWGWGHSAPCFSLGLVMFGGGGTVEDEWDVPTTAPPLLRNSLHVIPSSLSPHLPPLWLWRQTCSWPVAMATRYPITPSLLFSLPPFLSLFLSVWALVGPRWYRQHLAAAQWLQGGELRRRGVEESESASASLGSVHLSASFISSSPCSSSYLFIFYFFVFLSGVFSFFVWQIVSSAVVCMNVSISTRPAMVSAVFLVGMFWTGLAPDWDRHQLARRNGKAASDTVRVGPPPPPRSCCCQAGGVEYWLKWKVDEVHYYSDASVGNEPPTFLHKHAHTPLPKNSQHCDVDLADPSIVPLHLLQTSQSFVFPDKHKAHRFCWNTKQKIILCLFIYF